MLKILWDLVTKKDRLWIKWVNDYYTKGVNIMHFKVPSTASWMLSRIISSRDLLSSWDDLHKYVLNGKFNTKRAFMDRLATFFKPSWRAL